MTGSFLLTERLNLFMLGDSSSVDTMLEEIMPKLRQIASRELKRDHIIRPLCKTELVHELWVHNLSQGGWQIADRGHFFALASLAMRRILIEQARKRLTLHRGGGKSSLPLDDFSASVASSDSNAEKVVEIGMLMERLETKHPDAARMVDMHYFGGFTFEEIAKETGAHHQAGSRTLGQGLAMAEAGASLFMIPNPALGDARTIRHSSACDRDQT